MEIEALEVIKGAGTGGLLVLVLVGIYKTGKRLLDRAEAQDRAHRQALATIAALVESNRMICAVLLRAGWAREGELASPELPAEPAPED